MHESGMWDSAEPWTPVAEKAGKEVCARYSLGQIDQVLNQVGMGWEELMTVGVRRVIMRSSSHHIPSAGCAWHAQAYALEEACRGLPS